jgi:hypothetical protein
MPVRLIAMCSLVLLLAGCTATAPPSLPGLVHKDFPVYAPSTYKDSMGGKSGPDVGVLTHEGITWWLKTDDPRDKVVAFYNSRLPSAEKKEEDGSTLFTYKFPGAEEGEYIQVSIKDHEFAISEELKIGKRK